MSLLVLAAPLLAVVLQRAIANPLQGSQNRLAEQARPERAGRQTQVILRAVRQTEEAGAVENPPKRSSGESANPREPDTARL